MTDTWFSSNARVNGNSIHYRRTGMGDKPPLVLVHGFTDNGLSWINVAREFEKDFDVVMPDMVGHGLSSRLAAGATPDMPADLAGLIQTLGLTAPIICGHSMGAMVTFQASLRFPGLARAILLEDPPWFLHQGGPAPLQQPAADNPIAQWAKSLADASLEDLIAQSRKDNPSWSDEFIRIMCESKKQLDQGIIDTMADLIGSAELGWESNVARLAIPTQLIAGNPELGGIVNAEILDRVRALNPGVAIRVFPKLGHLIRFDAHQEFVATMRSFFERLAPPPNKKPGR